MMHLLSTALALLGMLSLPACLGSLRGSELQSKVEHQADGSHPHAASRSLSQSRQAQERPLRYWDQLRNSSTTFETQPGSAVYRVNTKKNETVRLAHVVGIYPFSETYSTGTRRLIDSFAHGTASVILAVKHFNDRSSPVVPNLSRILGDCNLYLTVDLRDTLLSPIVASQKVMQYFGRSPDSLSEPYPIAFSGATRSAVTEPLSILAGVYKTPVVNGLSTSTSLDNKDVFPTFTRSLPTNKVDSQAVVAYFKSLGVTHFGVLFIRDPYGSEFNRDLARQAELENMTVVSAAWDNNDASIIGALQTLQDTEFRYFFAIVAPAIDTHKIVIQKAIDLGIMGNPANVWLFSEASNILREESFYTSILNSSSVSDRAIASALNGMGLVVLEIPQNEEFNQALRAVGTDKDLYDYYTSRFESPELFDSLNWDPVPNFYQYSTYDALLSLGIGLCSLENEFPDGMEVVQAIKNTNFIASSGPISYDQHTGTRSPGSVKAKVINFLVDTSGSEIIPNLRTSVHVNVSSQEVEVLSRFLYSDGTPDPPLALPVLTVDLNLLGTGVRSVGWIVAGFIILSSIYCGYSAYRYRNKNIIRSAQPVFLGLLCIGVSLMSSAIIPMSFQEPMSQRTLNAGCMAVPWLFTMGFATAFSSLFCKLRRLNKVFRKAANMKHAQVMAKDVLLPFLVLFAANFALLLAWTLVAPLRWTRVVTNNYDQFGRSVESYGTCYAPSGTAREVSSRNAFLIALGLFNFAAVVLANYQCYLSRNTPSDFNESFFIGLSMLSILEGFLLGIPILFLTVAKPTAHYVVSTIVIFLLCTAILIPNIGFKVFAKKKHTKLRKSEWRRAWRNYDESSSRLPTVPVLGGSSSPGMNRRGSSDMSSRSSVAVIRARAEGMARRESSSFGSSSGGLPSREIHCHASSSLHSSHLSSVAAIRARVEEKKRRESMLVGS